MHALRPLDATLTDVLDLQLPAVMLAQIQFERAAEQLE